MAEITGLSDEEVLKLRAVHGVNAVPEHRVNMLLFLVKRFVGPIPLLLEIAIIVSAVLGDYVTTITIGVLLLFNAFMGTMQYKRSTKAMKELKKTIKLSTRVLRDGVWSVKDAVDLVPGDAIRIRHGDIAPADCAILLGHVAVDESVLTGETTVIDKTSAVSSTVRAGSRVAQGEATCRVSRTGASCLSGEVTTLIQKSRPPEQVTRVLLRVIAFTALTVMTLLSINVIITVLRGDSAMDVLPLVLLLFVIGFPLALPSMMSLSVHLGAVRASTMGVLVTRLFALFDAASMDVICLDKTGTLTKNENSVVSVITPLDLSVSSSRCVLSDNRATDVMAKASLCSEHSNADPIDTAIISYYSAMSVHVDGCTVLKFIPFSFTTKRTEADIQYNGVDAMVTKGAADVIMSLCNLSDDDRLKIKTELTAVGVAGRRAVCVASSGGDAWTFDGIITMEDPLRDDSAMIIKKLKSMGIRPIVISGDNVDVVRAVCKDLGVGDRVKSIKDVEGSDLNPDDLYNMVNDVDGLGGVEPKYKHAVVSALQRRGHVVGMSGDGMNDCPALKLAQVGVAVQGGVDMAKASASCVLNKPGISGIIPVINIGRSIYQRMMSFIILRSLKMFQTVLFISTIYIMTSEIAISANQIALMMLLMDIAVMSLSTDNVVPPRLPVKWSVKFIASIAMPLGILTWLEMLGFFYFAWNVLDYSSTSAGQLQTLFFLLNFVFGMYVVIDIIMQGIASLLSVRERRAMWAAKPSKVVSGVLLFETLAITTISVFGLLGLTAVPIVDALIVLAFCVIVPVINDFIKRFLLATLCIEGVNY